MAEPNPTRPRPRRKNKRKTKKGFPVGRPTVLDELVHGLDVDDKPATQSRREMILSAIRNGATRRAARGYAGVSEQTFWNWQQYARDGKEPYRLLFEDIERAESEAQIRMAKVVFEDGHAQKSARSALAWLKARFPNEWSDQIQVKPMDDIREEVRKLAREAGVDEEEALRQLEILRSSK